MDRKSIAILTVSFILLVAWYPLVSKIYPQSNQRQGTNQLSALGTNLATSRPQGTNPAPENAAQPAGAALGSSVSTAAANIFATAAATEKTIQLSNSFVRLTLSSSGGGIKEVELLKYRQSTARDQKNTLSTNHFVRLNNHQTSPSLALLGSSALVGDGTFSLTLTASGVRAEKRLTNGLLISKDFTLGPDYIVGVRTRIENASAEPVGLPAHEWVIGATALTHAADDPRHVMMQWFNGTKGQKVDDAWFKNYALGCIPGTPRTEYVEGNNTVQWAALNNQFFTIAALTASNAPANQVISRYIELPPPTPEQLKADPKLHLKPTGQQAGFLYPASVLAPKAAVERAFDFYAGPKEYKTLAKIGQDRANEFDLIMDFGSFFGLFSKALLLSMNLLHSWGLSYGLAIITITVIIKLVFWPLTKASTQSMKRMAALQPQMKALQEKYKDDPKKMNMKLMEFMRDNKVSPLGGCLPMMLQIPVFIGFFFMIQTAIELRGASFLWASDLSQPDTVAIILGLPLNIFPLLMGITQLWQIRLTPPSPGMDPVQQKIMQYMPLMFMFFLYQYAAGLTLYWTVQNLLSIAQMKLTKSDPTPTPGSITQSRPATPTRRK